MNALKPKRRWYQFSVWSLLVVTTLAAIILGLGRHGIRDYDPLLIVAVGVWLALARYTYLRQKAERERTDPVPEDEAPPPMQTP